MTWAVLAISSFTIAFFISKFLIYRGGLTLDIPNTRSSHSVTTPSGGGLGIIIAVLSVASATVLGQLFIAVPFSFLPLKNVLVVFTICGLVGFLDDRYKLSPVLRLTLELAIAVYLVYQGYVWNIFNFGFGEIVLPLWASGPFTVIWFVWMINLYNFMDGINGIAAITAVVVSLFLMVCGIKIADDFGLSLAALSLILASAVLGFFPSNFPVGKLFLGDVGSLSLGGVFAALFLALHKMFPHFDILIATLAIAPFFLDATFTLIKRAVQMKNVFSAHREHIYQRLTIRFKSHVKVTIIFGTLAAICCMQAYLYLFD